MAMTRKRRAFKAAFHLTCAVVVGCAAFIVPLPYIEYVPGHATEIPPLIEIDGIETTELDGEAYLLTIQMQQQPTVPALLAVFDDDRSLVSTEVIYGPGTNRQEVLTAERARFDRQFYMAAVVGAQAAGIEAEADTEVTIFAVAPDSPAEGILRRGDVVLDVDGEPIESAVELPEIIEQADPGDDVELTIRRGNDVEELTIEVDVFGPDDAVRLGVHIETTVGEVQLPFEIELGETRIGGPSAGMMVALTVYDLLNDEDLLAGRTVMGTGSLDSEGRVGPVGGVRQKMHTAVEREADVVLVPQVQAEDANDAVDTDIPIIGVATLDEAIEALRDIPS